MKRCARSSGIDPWGWLIDVLQFQSSRSQKLRLGATAVVHLLRHPFFAKTEWSQVEGDVRRWNIREYWWKVVVLMWCWLILLDTMPLSSGFWSCQCRWPLLCVGEISARLVWDVIYNWERHAICEYLRIYFGDLGLEFHGSRSFIWCQFLRGLMMLIVVHGGFISVVSLEVM